MGAVAASKNVYHRSRDWLAAYLANDDPIAATANFGAFLVWSNQPFYPLYVAWIVGRDAWPSLLTWLSTPFFYGVAIVGRAHPLASRVLFVAAGVANTLLSLKAFGTPSGVGWFFIPCLIIAATFFRAHEWKAAVALFLSTAMAALLVNRLGAPLHVYTPVQYASLARLNIWSASVLSIYLLVSVIRVKRRGPGDA